MIVPGGGFLPPSSRVSWFVPVGMVLDEIDTCITSLFKKKSSWKRLDNYRGIFIVMILHLIYKKVLKNRIAGVLEANVSKFQNGGAKGKSVTDNLFILKGGTDHARYLGTERSSSLSMILKNVLTAFGCRIA